jgi:hypothetical protein
LQDQEDQVHPSTSAKVISQPPLLHSTTTSTTSTTVMAEEKILLVDPSLTESASAEKSSQLKPSVRGLAVSGTYTTIQIQNIHCDLGWGGVINCQREREIVVVFKI